MVKKSPSLRLLSTWVVCGVLGGACGTRDVGPAPSGDGDGDGSTTIWVAVDTDGDGIFDGIDTNGDGIADIVGTPIDSDGDGVIDSLDTDGDGIPDVALPGFTLPGSESGGSSGLGTGGGRLSGMCNGPGVRGGLEPLIDDLEHEGSALLPRLDHRIGRWFTAEDLAAGAAQTPPAGEIFPTFGVGTDGSYGFASSLTGFSGRSIDDSGIGWGPQFGLSLNDDDGNLCAYDASAYDGVAFCARSGDGGTYTLQFAASMLVVIPVTRGGTCAGDGCGDVHFKSITVHPEWSCDYRIKWDDLRQNPNLMHNNKYDFDPGDIALLTWTSWLGDYDVVIDDVRFLGNEMPSSGGAGGESGFAGFGGTE